MPSIPVNEKTPLKLGTLSDASQFYKVIQDSQDYLRKYIPWVDHVNSEKAAEAFLLK